MFAKIISASLNGLNAGIIEVEADAGPGIPSFNVTGAVSSETREAQYRVRNALGNSGIKLRPQKITVNITPASSRKEGTGYDLPIAVAVMCASGIFDYRMLSDIAYIGETGLDGQLRGVRGILPISLSLRAHGTEVIILPLQNAAEASLTGIREIYACSSLRDVIEVSAAIIRRKQASTEAESEGQERVLYRYRYRSTGADARDMHSDVPDFSDVFGQEFLKRAAEIAVSGRHNILISGPAGTGKTMIARRMSGIMPEPSREEVMKISEVYSICGLLDDGASLKSSRPFRAPHHGISQAAFAGGGPSALPGEISLASGGILFLDELPLFSREVLESLRQPLEEKRITVTRMRGSYTYPADFQLVAAMNSCACGYYPDIRRCSCTRAQIKAYMGRLSRPLMERIDICAQARPLSYEEMTGAEGRTGKKSDSSADIRKRVAETVKLQLERTAGEGGIMNSAMSPSQIRKYCVLGKAEDEFLRALFAKKELSGRTYHKILRVARTIADMDGRPDIRVEDLAEASELRSLEDRLYNERQQ